MATPHDTLLGRPVAYPRDYDPTLLQPIPRALGRAAIGMGDELPFTGVDIWNAYELGWLDARGKPRVGLAELRVPADSPHLIESKSLKLYLNSFGQARQRDSESLRATLVQDLSACAGAEVSVVILAASAHGFAIESLAGELIDDQPLEISHYGPPRPEFLQADDEVRADETLVSHLLKSNCPVTGQPDWASVQVRYVGPRLDRAGLLRYLVSFREHADFHEQCVERIFCDLMQRCHPAKLSVYARYTRRGGLDINPYRSTPGLSPPGNPRTARQ